MKRYLLSMMLCALACVGAKAYSYSADDGSVKFSDDGANIQKVEVTAGGLATWLEWYDQQSEADQALGKNPDRTKLVITGTLNAEDLAVLSSEKVTGFSTFTTVDMDGVTLADGTAASALLAMKLSGAEYFALPFGVDKATVKAFGDAQKTSSIFKSAYSANSTYTDFVVYVNQGGTLRTCIDATVDNAADKVKTATSLTVIGTPLPIDIACGYPNESNQLDADGHVSVSVDVSVSNVTFTGTGSVTLNSVWNPTWAFRDATIVTLDLSDAHFDNAADMTLPVLGYGRSGLKYLTLPIGDPSFTEIPRGCFANQQTLISVNIPSTVENILSGSFYGDGNLMHVWTDGDNNKILYDNGAVTAVADDYTETVVTHDNIIGTTPLYGTWTLPGNLKLIETYSFSGEHVKDLYVLAEKAPICEVDAFGVNMYDAQNGYSSDVITAEGMVTRHAYRNHGTANFNADPEKEAWRWITMLHFPASIGTPDVQRYTDPTRQYSVATSMKDDRGNTIYFPTQNEWGRAYEQGTYGYTWNAWDTKRDNDGNNSIFKIYDIETYGYSSTTQAEINKNYSSTWTSTSPYTSFYDVTDGGNLSQPEGLKYYYNVYWDEKALNDAGDGTQLYPAPETTGVTYYKYVSASADDFLNNITCYTRDDDGNYTEAASYSEGTTYYKRVQTQVRNEDGSLKFNKCDNGLYVEKYTYVQRDNGGYVRGVTLDGYEATTTSVAGVEAYYSDESGTKATPKVNGTYYVRDGEKNDYDVVDKNKEAVGARSQYYKEEGGVKVPTDLHFWNTMYYATDETETVNKYTKLASAWGTTTTTTVIEAAQAVNVDENGLYVLRDGKYTLGMPNIAESYIKNDDGTFTKVGVMQSFNTVYWNGAGSWATQTSPAVTEDVYYSESVEQPKYGESNIYLPGKEWYTKSGDTYTKVDNLNWYTHISESQTTLYYVSGTSPNYVSANGTDYNSETTYYTDEGTTEAETVTFDKTYYVAKYTYDFREYTSTDGDEQQWAKVPYYELAEEGDESQRFCPDMVDVLFEDVAKSYDYRGWHQFVLTGYSKNSTEDVVYERMYTSDDDWWTICLPYDLTRSEMMKFFSNGTKEPYLSKLMYVTRDIENGKITLCFSKNLMNYKEKFAETPAVGSDGIRTSTAVHGTRTNDILDILDTKPDDNDIVLFAGVPYLIKPSMPASANHRFEIYLNDEKYLYNKLKKAQEMGTEMNDLIYAGEYTVPALVLNNTTDATAEATEGTVTIGDKTYEVSTEFKYTFIGSFFLGLLPQYSYFLGIKNGKAAFWYNRVNDPANWTWSNQTGIIGANFDTNTKITPADAGNFIPARWEIKNLANDDFKKSTGGAKMSPGMFFGAEGATPTGIEEIAVEAEAAETGALKVYSSNGVYMGGSLKALPKGLYIVNGKKYVVK